MNDVYNKRIERVKKQIAEHNIDCSIKISLKAVHFSSGSVQYKKKGGFS